MKKSLFTAVLALGLSQAGMISKAVAQESTEKKKIALVVSTLNNPFFVSMKEGAEKKAQELGLTLTVLDSENDPAKELSNLEDLITQKVAVILVNPTDSDAVSNGIRAANKAGIPVITLDRGATRGIVVSFVASDNTAGGRLAGDFIAEKLGKQVKVIQLEGISGTSAARERGAGFAQALKAHEFDLLASQAADFDRTKGLNVMENLLVGHNDVQAVFAQNDEMALGALKAVTSSNRDILIVGFDGTDEGIAAVKAKKLAATVAQQPALIGEMGVEIADKTLKGEKVEPFIPVPLQIISE